MSENIKKMREKFESQAILAHIEMLQGIISRMAANSANCKTWALTILCAVLALTNLSGEKLAIISFGVIILMWLLDCFYLGLERHFKEVQKTFATKVGKGNKYELFSFPSTTFLQQLLGTIGGVVSFSTTPFYLVLAIMTWIIISL